MRSNLSFNDRREQILSYLAVRKKTTRFELASEFCESLDTIDRDITEICKLLESKKIKYAKVCGEVKDRASEVDAFQNNPECIVFVGQLQTISMGLTLTASSTMVFYSLSYNFADYSQARARIHRIGQRNTCQYIHLVAKDTIDETVLKALEQKENIATKIVDDWRSIIR